MTWKIMVRRQGSGLGSTSALLPTQGVWSKLVLHVYTVHVFATLPLCPAIAKRSGGANSVKSLVFVMHLAVTSSPMGGIVVLMDPAIAKRCTQHHPTATSAMHIITVEVALGRHATHFAAAQLHVMDMDLAAPRELVSVTWAGMEQPA
jgi:hypothetical protein